MNFKLETKISNIKDKDSFSAEAETYKAYKNTSIVAQLISAATQTPPLVAILLIWLPLWAAVSIALAVSFALIEWNFRAFIVSITRQFRNSKKTDVLAICTAVLLTGLSLSLSYKGTFNTIREPVFPHEISMDLTRASTLSAEYEQRATATAQKWDGKIDYATAEIQRFERKAANGEKWAASHVSSWKRKKATYEESKAAALLAVSTAKEKAVQAARTAAQDEQAARSTVAASQADAQDGKNLVYARLISWLAVLSVVLAVICIVKITLIEERYFEREYQLDQREPLALLFYQKVAGLFYKYGLRLINKIDPEQAAPQVRRAVGFNSSYKETKQPVTAEITEGYTLTNTDNQSAVIETIIHEGKRMTKSDVKRRVAIYEKRDTDNAEKQKRYWSSRLAEFEH